MVTKVKGANFLLLHPLYLSTESQTPFAYAAQCTLKQRQKSEATRVETLHLVDWPLLPVLLAPGSECFLPSIDMEREWKALCSGGSHISPQLQNNRILWQLKDLSYNPE